MWLWGRRELDCLRSLAASSRGPFLGLGLIMHRLATPSECRQQATHCRTRADTATDERVRALWISMAQMWTKLGDRLQRLNVQEAYGDTATEMRRRGHPFRATRVVSLTVLHRR
jgi:hypothetical protein